MVFSVSKKILLVLFFASSVARPISWKEEASGVTIRIVGGNPQTGDVLKQKFSKGQTAAAVNAANTAVHRVAGAKTISGQFFAAAGSDLRDESVMRWGDTKVLSVGAAATLGAHNLRKRGYSHVIFAVGPDCNDATQNANRKKLLRNVYTNILAQADANAIQNVAIPSISTGVFAYPLAEAISVAIDACATYLLIHKSKTQIKEIRFVCWDKTQLFTYVATFLRSSESYEGLVFVLNDKEPGAMDLLKASGAARGVFSVGAEEGSDDDDADEDSENKDQDSAADGAIAGPVEVTSKDAIAVRVKVCIDANVEDPTLRDFFNQSFTALQGS